MKHLISVDPSIRSAGVAWFQDRELTGAIRVCEELSQDNTGIRCLRMAGAIFKFTSLNTADLAFEWPQIYRAVKSKGDPNDLIGIAGVGSALAGLMAGRALLGGLSTPTPAEWIGQLPKTCQLCKGKRKRTCRCKGSSWATPRGMRIRSRLTAAELALIPDQNDVIDAVGIGLYALGRLDPARVFAGAV